MEKTGKKQDGDTKKKGEAEKKTHPLQNCQAEKIGGGPGKNKKPKNRKGGGGVGGKASTGLTDKDKLKKRG